jgi:hypothetical protein
MGEERGRERAPVKVLSSLGICPAFLEDLLDFPFGTNDDDGDWRVREAVPARHLGVSIGFSPLQISRVITLTC